MNPHAVALRSVIAFARSLRDQSTSRDERTSFESLLEHAEKEQADANMIAEQRRDPVIVERNTREQYLFAKAMPSKLYEYQPVSDEELADGARRIGLYGRTGS